jgi:hypothetical protein
MVQEIEIVFAFVGMQPGNMHSVPTIKPAFK